MSIVNSQLYEKTYTNLGKDRYYSTIWCTLDSSTIQYLHSILEPIVKYCKWVCSFGDMNESHYYLHLTLRYLGFSDELSREFVLRNVDIFKKILKEISIKELSLGKLTIYDKKQNGELYEARLNWEIINKEVLIDIHKKLLQVKGFQFFSELEGDKYIPHLSLGSITLEGNNYIKVKEYLESLPNTNRVASIDQFALNYTSHKGRESILL